MKKRPNVVLIIADQLNYKNIGCYGNDVIKTPNIDYLASNGIKFEDAYCQAPLCMPSRASFNTGMYPHTCGVRYNPSVLSSKFTTIAEVFKENGYKTGGFGHIGGDGLERGFDRKIDLIDEPLKTAWMEEQKHVLKNGGQPGYFHSKIPMTKGKTFDGLVSKHATNFIEESKEPFYLQIDFYRPHTPCTIPSDFSHIYKTDNIVLPSNYKDEMGNKPNNVKYTRKALGMENLGELELKEAISYYYSSVGYIDSLIGNINCELKRKNIFDDTIIIFISDHGDYAGEFGIIGKTGNFYESLIHVPFIICGKNYGVKKNESIEGNVELIDIFPTLLEACGIERIQQLQGKSRWNLCKNKSRKVESTVFSETSGVLNINSEYKFSKQAVNTLPTDPYSSSAFSHVMQGIMIKKGKMKLSYYTDGYKELYDLEKDSLETNNLCNNENYKQLLYELIEKLLEWKISTPFPDECQYPLPYHYKAFYIDSIPEPYKTIRLEKEKNKLK